MNRTSVREDSTELRPLADVAFEITGSLWQGFLGLTDIQDDNLPAFRSYYLRGGEPDTR